MLRALSIAAVTVVFMTVSTGATHYYQVTAKPFRADTSGKRDSTEALQKAIDFAREHLMVSFFPGGTYRVSGTLSAVKPGGGPWGLNLRAWSRMTAAVLVARPSQSRINR